VFVGLSAGQLGDRFSRVRVLLWGMVPAIAFHFLMAFMPDRQPVLFAVLYACLGLTETWAIVTVNALLRDFSPRTARALQVVQSLAQRTIIERRAAELKGTPVRVHGFWSFIRSDWCLWALGLAQGLFLFGYRTFVAYGSLFTVHAYSLQPQEGSRVTSWVYASIIVFLLVSGLVSDRLRLRKLIGVVFTLLSGAALISLGLTVGRQWTTAEMIAFYVIIGAVMATMWSPTNALFSETAEDIAATRQTTAFAGQQVINSIITQVWLFVALSLLADHGWQLIWTICGLGAIAAAPIMAGCRGGWGRFPSKCVRHHPPGLRSAVPHPRKVGILGLALDCTQRHERCALGSGYASGPRDVQALVPAIPAQRAQMGATASFPDSRRSVKATAGK
jgi:MFS family permease